MFDSDNVIVDVGAALNVVFVTKIVAVSAVVLVSLVFGVDSVAFVVVAVEGCLVVTAENNKINCCRKQILYINLYLSC